MELKSSMVACIKEEKLTCKLIRPMQSHDDRQELIMELFLCR